MKWIKLSTATFEGLSMKMMRAKDPDNYFRNTSVMTHLLTLCGKSDTAGELRSADGTPLTTSEMAVVTGLPECDIMESILKLSDPAVGILGATEDGAYKFLAPAGLLLRQRRLVLKGCSTSGGRFTQRRRPNQLQKSLGGSL